jgi:cytochrome c553
MGQKHLSIFLSQTRYIAMIVKKNLVLFIAVILVLIQCKEEPKLITALVIPPAVTLDLDPVLVAEGKETFRHNTFADEALWTDVLHLDKAILGEANGGFGPGLSPVTALSIGLKVDAEALPQSVVDGISDGSIDLNDPMTTAALLSLDAVVGVKGSFDNDGNLASIGVTCALCHSTVDDSFAPGIGSRKDGWANMDLNVGAILGFVDNQALADILSVDVGTFNSVVNNWGPGRFAPVLLMDGKVTKPNGELATVVIPPAYGLQGLTHETYTGWGEISYWNRFIGVLDMGGQGNFVDPRLNDPDKFPLAVARGLYDVNVQGEDLIDPKLEGLLEYQLSLLAPVPDPSSYNEPAAIRGQQLFEGKANCAACHAGPAFADNVLHSPEEIGIDDFEANRSPTGMYRTPPLRGIFVKASGNGFFHDGRFATLNEVVTHYDSHFNLKLSDDEMLDIVEYLKAL